MTERLDPDEADIFRAELAAVQEAEELDIARDCALFTVERLTLNFRRWRTRAYVETAEGRKRRWLAGLPPEEQARVIHAGVRALHALMTTKGRPYGGLSILPRDLYSGFHAADQLYSQGEHPRLWRPIVIEGVASGALVFAESSLFATIAANPSWDGQFIDRASEKELRACKAAMSQPYPDTLPSPSFLLVEGSKP